MRRAFLAICFVVAGCEVNQPESIKTVAAFEIPLVTERERDEFLSILRPIAKAEGMHIDAESKADLQETAKVIPEAEMTIHAAVWRGSNDDDAEVVIMDEHGHLGQVWITFLRGKDPQLARRFREHAMREIRLRWPGTLSLPIMPTGAIPLHDDLQRIPGGYIVKPSAAYKYAKSQSQ